MATRPFQSRQAGMWLGCGNSKITLYFAGASVALATSLKGLQLLVSEESDP